MFTIKFLELKKKESLKKLSSTTLEKMQIIVSRIMQGAMP